MIAKRFGYTAADRSKNNSGVIGVKFAGLRSKPCSKILAMLSLDIDLL
jgi:hypothetical protein